LKERKLLSLPELKVNKESKDIFKEEDKCQVLKEKNVRMEKTFFSA